MRLNNPARADLTGDPMGSALWSQLAGDAVKWPGNVPVTSCWDQISTKQIIAVKASVGVVAENGPTRC